MKTKLKFFLALLALMVVGVNCVWGAYTYETVTYDFGTAAKTTGAELNMSSTNYAALNNAFYGATMTYGGNTVDISKFAFRSILNGQGWRLYDNTNGSETSTLYGLNAIAGQSNPNYPFAICNLHAGDKVKITYSGGEISYFSGAHGYKTNNLNVLTVIPTETEITISQNGDMIIQASSYSNPTYIQTIEIKTLQDVATYTVVTTEDTNNNTSSTTFTFTGQGRMEDNVISVPFMDVQFGSYLNAPLVEALGNEGNYWISHTPDWNGYWHVWFDGTPNLPYQGTFYKFMPTATGKLQMNGYLNTGSIYLYEVDESNGTYTQKASSSTTGTIMLPNQSWVTLEKGKTYYVCDDPTNRSNNYFGLHNFTFVNEFYMKQSAVLTNGATSGTLATVKGANRLESYTIKRVSGNINQSGITVSFTGNSSAGTLSISDISYADNTKDKGGVIIVDLVFDGGNATFVVTIPYSAQKGHIWNFYDTSKSTNAGTGPLEIGKYSDNTSELYRETEAGKWKYTYRVINNQRVGTHDPMYQSVELMDGNNAAYIWETEGLIFNTPTLKACLYNENPLNATAYTDRYVGILPGGSFTIPALTAGDRVVIYMASGDGSSSDVCFFNITGAQDAIGTNIDATKTYKAGGSLWNGDHSDYNIRGAYHFISTGGPMTFYMNGGSMTKIYSIEIYRGDHKFTVDATRTTATYNGTAYNAYTYQILSTYKDNPSTTKNACYQLHYRGKGDVLKSPVVLYSSGTVNTDANHLFYGTITSANGNINPYIFYKSTPGEIGMFRMRIETIEQGTESYVADYGLQNITVGYLEKKTYPYTWDFTDLLSYSTSKISADISASNTYNQNKGITEFMNRYSPIEENGPYYNSVALWKQYTDTYGGYGIQLRNNYYQNTTNTEGSGELMFTPGSQLFAGSNYITESSGIGFTPRGSESKRNERLRITNDGLYLYEQSGDYWLVTIPEVQNGAAVYIRVKNIVDGSGNRPITAEYSNENRDAAGRLIFTDPVSLTAGEDHIYVAIGTGTDMTFKLSNAIVQKIAVSTEAKQFNAKGWTTESRSRDIDPSLTAYMTGHNIKTYLVTNVAYSNKTVELTEIGSNTTKDYLMHKSTANDDVYACILRNDADEQLNIINNSFHLFVPDMHDEQGETTGTDYKKKNYYTTKTSKMKSRVNGGTIAYKSGDYWNYGLGYQYYDIDPETGKEVSGSSLHEGVVAFYRIAHPSASCAANKGYLPVSMSGSGGSSRFTIVFANDEDNETSGIVANKTEGMADEGARYYNLNGQQLSGKPNRQGLYIVNGKKMYVK